MFNKTEERKTFVAEVGNTSNVISKETRITGDIKALGNIRIEGTVEGTIQSKGKLEIGDTSLIKGNISSVEAEIAGKIEGEVYCSDSLFLRKTAVILGNITTQKIIVENGAVFNGKCQMNTSSMVVSKTEIKDDEQSETRPKQNSAG